MIELLKFLLTYSHYHAYRSYVPKAADSTVHRLYTLLDDLINSLQRDLSFDEYRLHCLANLPNVTKADKEHREIAEQLLVKAESIEIAEDAALAVLEDLGRKANAFGLASKLLDYSEGRVEYSEVEKGIASLGTSTKLQEELEFVSDDLEELYSTTVATPGLRWRLDSLNKSLGSLRKGDFGFIFARPETGKTTFLASEVSHMARQTDGDILWFNNEQEGNKVKLRVYEALFGLQLKDLTKDMGKYRTAFQKELGSRFKLNRDSEIIDRKYIEKVLANTKPALMVIDQIDKVKGFKEDRDDLMYGAIYQWARDLAKEYCPIIGVTQAGGSAEGKKWLTMDDVANAKTSKQAEADFIIGIGKQNDPTLEFVRHFNVCKNKMLGDEDTDPTMRHGHWDVLILPEHARYKDF